MVRARFIGDPVERSEGRFTNPPSDEWFDIPEGEEAKYRGNAHYEVEGEPTPPPAPRRRAAKRAEPPPIQHEGWEEGEE
jgi:hypothetical protein